MYKPPTEQHRVDFCLESITLSSTVILRLDTKVSSIPGDSERETGLRQVKITDILIDTYLFLISARQ